MSRLHLTLNAGSSSLKFALYGPTGDAPLATGLADRIGGAGSLAFRLGEDGAAQKSPAAIASHAAALEAILAALHSHFPGLDVAAVGHRIVHGGLAFTKPVVITPETLAALEALVPFAPLHQPHNIAGIRAAMQAFPAAVQVGCFDTAFHRSHPFVNDTFALPRAYYEKGVRRYGFHGLSYEYIASELQRRAPRLAEGRVIVAHLGNGASVCALLAGRSIASTMGFTALDGLPMGTRCGQLDPGVVLYLMEQEKLSAAEIADLLYRQSGLLGLSGLSNDMRELEAAHTPEAASAIDYFVFRVQREFGGLAAALGGVDAIVFCGGIGENASAIRARICERLAWMGVELDHARNDRSDGLISSDLSRVTVMTIKTNEELVIARALRSLQPG